MRRTCHLHLKRNFFLPFVTEEGDTQKKDIYHSNDQNENSKRNGRGR